MCANSDLSCLQWHILSPSTFRACNLFFCLDSIVWFIPQFDFISDLIALSLAPALLFCYFFSHLFTIWPFLDLIQKTYIALAIAILLFLVFFPSLSPTLQFTQRRDVGKVRLTRLTLTSMRLDFGSTQSWKIMGSCLGIGPAKSGEQWEAAQSWDQTQAELYYAYSYSLLHITFCNVIWSNLRFLWVTLYCIILCIKLSENWKHKSRKYGWVSGFGSVLKRKTFFQ